MSMEEEGRSRTARHELLKMVPNTDDAAALVRPFSEFPCTLRGNAPPRHTANACAAGANATDLLPNIVVSTGEALRSGTAVGEVVSPSWPRGCQLLLLPRGRLLWLVLLPWGRLVLLVLLPWGRLVLLPRVHLLWMTLLLVAALTIVVALG